MMASSSRPGKPARRWPTSSRAWPRCRSASSLAAPGSTRQRSASTRWGVMRDCLGLPLDQFLAQRIFEPLGMPSTGSGAGRRTRARGRRVRRSRGRLADGDADRVLGLSTDPTNRYFSGGGGTDGTAADYSRFAMLLANGGQLDGQRLLGRRTVALMASNQIGHLPLDRSQSDMRGYRFGLGVRVLESPSEDRGAGWRRHVRWAGAFGTNSPIDPARAWSGCC